MKPSEVPDNLKGNISYSEDGIMTLNHPEKGIVLLEPDPILITPEDFPDLPMIYLITMVEAIATSLSVTPEQIAKAKGGLLTRMWNGLFAKGAVIK